jgi:GNAT superfamily N-acetyltransferase
VNSARIPRDARLRPVALRDRAAAASSLLLRSRRLWWRLRTRLSARLRALGPAGARSRILYVCDLQEEPQRLVSVSDVHFICRSVAELGEDAVLRSADVPATRRDLPEDAGCLVGLIADRVVYRVFYVRVRAEQLRDLPPDWTPRGRVLFVHGGHTDEAFRGRGIHTAALQQLIDRQRGTEVAHIVGIVDAGNAPARRTLERQGFRALRRIE